MNASTPTDKPISQKPNSGKSFILKYARTQLSGKSERKPMIWLDESPNRPAIIPKKSLILRWKTITRRTSDRFDRSSTLGTDAAGVVCKVIVAGGAEAHLWPMTIQPPDYDPGYGQQGE